MRGHTSQLPNTHPPKKVSLLVKLEHAVILQTFGFDRKQGGLSPDDVFCVLINLFIKFVFVFHKIYVYLQFAS